MICQGDGPLTVQAGESSPRVAMTSSTFFMASGTASASTSLRLLLHSYMTCLHPSTHLSPRTPHVMHACVEDGMSCARQSA